MPEHEILEGSTSDSSDLLIDSGHHAIVGSLKPMRGTGFLKQVEQYPGSTGLIMDLERYERNYTHLRLANSIALYCLNEFRGMKIIIVPDSMIDPTTHFPYLHQDVSLVAMPQSTLQQRAALVATISDALEQVTPVIVMLGFDDHLDLNEHLKKLFAKNVTTQDIHRIDYPRLLSELSKTLSLMPLLEPLELKIDNCTLREDNGYMRMFQPWNERQEPIDPPKGSCAWLKDQ